MQNLIERITLVLSEMDGPERGKQTRLAKIAGCSRGLVHQWLIGANETMGYEYAKAICNELGYSIDWLMEGKGPPRKQNPIRLAHSNVPQVKEGDERYGLQEKHEEIVISQYHGVGGSMGNGILLRDQPGEIQEWKVTPEWVRKNIKAYSSIQNLKIVTGFGDSMKGLYNPGDPLICDTGIRAVEWDTVYFFRIGEEGFIKRLQRIPGQGILVISENKAYRDWMITQDMDFEVFGQILKAWNSTDF